MIKTIIIEDEIHLRELIERRLLKYFANDIELVYQADSVSSGIQAVQKFSPHLVFLDVQLLDGTGFEVLEACDNKDFETIIITAFDHFAIKAIKANVLDYILKPIDEKEFVMAVSNAIKRIQSDDHKQAPVESLSSKTIENDKRVILKTHESIYSINESQIIYCKSDGNYTRVFLENDTSILISKTAKVIEESLNPEIFIRCHKSYIVNKNYTSQYSKEGFLILKQHIKIPVSTRKKQETLNKIFPK